jgi:hypothetical protein
MSSKIEVDSNNIKLVIARNEAIAYFTERSSRVRDCFVPRNDKFISLQYNL